MSYSSDCIRTELWSKHHHDLDKNRENLERYDLLKACLKTFINSVLLLPMDLSH